MNSLHKLSDSDLLRYYTMYKNMVSNNKRNENNKRFQLDTKFAYHVVRLVNQAIQILSEGDLDLEKDREQLKSIRRGEWQFEDIENYFKRNEPVLEKLYLESSAVPMKIRESELKKLLLDCFEMYYGSIDKSLVEQQDVYQNSINEIRQIINRL